MSLPYGLMHIGSRRVEKTMESELNKDSNARGKPSDQVEYSPNGDLDQVSYVDAAHIDAVREYVRINPMSSIAHQRSCRYTSGVNPGAVVVAGALFPLTFVAGKGCELKSKDGDTYNDFLGEYSTGIFGHSDPFIKASVDRAMAVGWNLGGPNEFGHKLEEKITQRFGPSGCELVRFANSVAEANAMAVAAAVAFTRSDYILAFRGGQHEDIMSIPPASNTDNYNLPYNFLLAEYNNMESTHRMLRCVSHGELAAIIVKPIQGESGGCLVGSRNFLNYLQWYADRLGAVFIVDETMTSRLAYNGISNHLGIQPDIITLGGWIGGGLTFGAVGCLKNGPLMSMLDPPAGEQHYARTCSNNVLTMAAGCAALSVYDEFQVVMLNTVGETMREAVEALLKKYGVSPAPELYMGLSKEKMVALPKESRPTMWISGQGSLLCINFGNQLKDEEKLHELYWLHMLEHRIYLSRKGFMSLNIAMEQGHVDKFLEATERFVIKYAPALREVEDRQVEEVDSEVVEAASMSCDCRAAIRCRGC